MTHSKSFKTFFTSLLILSFSNIVSSCDCPTVSTVSNFNLTEYIKEKWYIQLQQETPYLPKDVNYCVTAQYNIINKKILFYDGIVLGVHNNARINGINGSELNAFNNTLCARIPNRSTQSKLLVAPCFLPNIVAGDYWVIAAGPQENNYEWAIVLGGNPTVKLDDGCTTKTDRINNSGFWFFTREINPSNSIIEKMKNISSEKGLSLKLMNKVVQDGCY
jgi:lipocalin